jgi:site-specific recombinase
MAALPPNQAARRLLDDFLARPEVPALRAILRWLLEASPRPTGAEIPRTRRLGVLTEALATHPSRDELRRRVREVWGHGSTVRLFAEAGLPQHHTLLKESLERLIDGLVPRLESENDLYALISGLRLTEDDAAWVEGLSSESLAPWRPLLTPPDRHLMDAARLVALRAAATGVARGLLELRPGRPAVESPFFRLPAAVERLVAAPADTPSLAAWQEVEWACRTELAQAHARLEIKGITTDLIFQLDLLETQLIRLDELLGIIVGRRDGRTLACELIRGSIRQRGVRSLTRTTLKRLARKVTEHTAETGEHYVARDAAEWDATGRAAAGGGVVTAFTALVKYAIGAVPLAPGIAGLAYALNYSVSFVTMQLSGFTLASKQPAMTGAALAEALGDRQALAAQVELVAGIARSQVAATIGNVFATVPVAALLVVLWTLGAGTPLMDTAKASATVLELHPLRSLTLVYAVITGVLLWLASLAAGWAANWSAYRGLPEALASHPRLTAAIGPIRAEALGTFTSKHLSGIVGYVVLGFLLGFLPVLLTFGGLPIEVRHVTLQSASLGLAAASLYAQGLLSWREAAWGTGGILVTAVCNIGISFALAMRTAMRARDLGHAERSRLWAALRQAFRREPRRFLWRPAGRA